jgi:hypothetical protein
MNFREWDSLEEDCVWIVGVARGFDCKFIRRRECVFWRTPGYAPGRRLGSRSGFTLLKSLGDFLFGITD